MKVLVGLRIAEVFRMKSAVRKSNNLRCMTTEYIFMTNILRVL